MLKHCVLLSLLAGCFIHAAKAATIEKTNNADALNLGSSWVGGNAPGATDLASWSGVVTGANTVNLGADTNWLGLKVTNPGGLLTINPGNILGLGGSGIDLSTSTVSLTLNCGLSLLSPQTWSISNGLNFMIGGTIAGTNVTITKTGAGTVSLNSANTFSGTMNVTGGKVALNNARGLGYASAVVGNAAQIYIGTAATYTNALTLTGNGDQGALRFSGGTATCSGPITLANGARIGGYAASGSYTLSGGITGTGDLRFWAGGASASHVHTFTISAPSTYSGDTLLETYAACPVLALNGGPNVLPSTTRLLMLAGVWNGQVLTATLKLNGNSQALAGLLSGSGVFGTGGTNRVVNGSSTPATLTVNCGTEQVFDGALGWTTANDNNFGFSKHGSGRLTIKDACTHTGATVVNAGILNLLGTLRGGAVTVANGATLVLGSGSNSVASLTLNPTAALGVSVGSASNASNTVVQVNGNLVLDGSIIVQDLGDAAPGTVLTVINYTGSLSNQGLTTDPRSQWAVQVDTSVTNKVRLVLQSKAPLIAFTTPNMTVSNSLQLQMQGVLRGFPLSPVYYEVETPDGRLWDFGAMPPTSPWTIRLRHLREGTNNVRVYTPGTGGLVQQDTRQVVLQLGTNPPVRPRPYPAEIWWGGVATELPPDYGYAQLSDPARPWTFVQKYHDGIFLHGILPAPGTLANLAAAVAPWLGRFGRENSYYTQADPNFGLNRASGYNSDLQSLAGCGLHITFHSVDFNPGMRVWANVVDPGWCQKWPNWTHAQLLNTNMQCWSDFVDAVHKNWPGIKLGWTWSPVWFNWGGYPALVPSGDNLTLHPVKDASGTVVTNQYGTNAWFDFDMQEFFLKAAVTAAASDGYFGFASDCPYDYFATWANAADRASNQAKILAYETWQRTNGYFPTTICNYSANSATDHDAWDATFARNSFSYILAKQQLGGRTQKYLFESWYDGPYTWAPESNTNSFTGLVKQALKYLKGVADTNGTLEPMQLNLLSASGGFKQFELRNLGDIQCLPSLVALPGSTPGVTTRFFTVNGTELTAKMQTAEGLCFTNLLQPGAATNLFAASTATALSAPSSENASVEAFWNPQDPLGVVRDREYFTPTFEPLGSWQTQDIGTGGLPGGAGCSSNVFTVIGSGADIWDVSDTFRFVYLPVSGDGSITARVSAQLNSDGWAKAGVMMRETLAANARNAFLAVTPSNGVTFQSRGVTGGASTSTKLAGPTAPYWVRLTRSGTTLTGYYSANGSTWTQLGSTNLAALSATAYFGLAVCSHNAALASVASFDSLGVVGANHPPVFSAIPNPVLIAGATLMLPLTNYVSDPDVPRQKLVFSLLSGPTNATVAPDTGVLTWRPLLAQAPSVTSVRVAVTDNGFPPMSATQSFSVTVIAATQPRLGNFSTAEKPFSFTVYGDAGPDYTILRSTNLVDWTSTWTNLSGVPPFVFSDLAPSNSPRRFYRVQIGP